MPTLGDRLAAARRDRFVGRRDELAYVHKLIAGDTGAVVLVHGPGGVGKSALLHQIAHDAIAADRHVGQFDAGSGPAPALDELGVARRPRALLLIDNVDAGSPTGRWVRDELLPGLGSDAVAVLAGRGVPDPRWRTDPGWLELVHPLALGNLDDGDARELLRRRGVPDPVHPAALAFTRGHALALTLVADDYAQRGRWVAPTRSPGVITALLASLVDAVPGPGHRAALEASAHVRTITEPLLAAMLETDDTRSVFGWLAQLSIVEYSGRGLRLHELAAEVLTAELRWRDPDRQALLLRRAGAYYRRRLEAAEPAAREAALLDYALLSHARPVMSAVVVAPPDTDDELTVAPATDAQWPAMRAALARFEGDRSADLADHWYRTRPGSTFAIPDATGALAGWFQLLTLHDLSPSDLDIDPAVRQVRANLDATAPLHAGEVAYLLRFWLGLAEYQAVGPAQTRMAFFLAQHYLVTPRLAYSYQVHADPDFWAEASAHADMHRLPAADFTVDGRAYGVYGHDWRTVPPQAWLSAVAQRQAGAAPVVPPPRTTDRLDSVTFAAEVRRVLPVLNQPDKLGRSPLLASRLVLSRVDSAAGAPQRAAALRQAIVDTAGVMAQAPRDRRALRVLHHTYIQPADTQRDAAELLDLPMSTYRRHLAAGVARLTDLLWQREQEPEP